MVTLTVALVVILSYVTNIFRASKVDNIELGDTQEQVIKVLGDYHEEDKLRWYYYDDNYMELFNEFNELAEKLLIVESESQAEKIMKRMIELEEEALTLEYKVIEIIFNAEKTVEKISYNAAMCEVPENMVKWTGFDKNEEIKIDDVFVGESLYSLPVKIYYKDGSYQNYIAYVNEATDSSGQKISASKIEKAGVYTITFEDDWGKYTTAINVKEMIPTTKDGVNYLGTKKNPYKNLVGVKEKGRLNAVTIPDGTEIIDAEAFKDCVNLKSVFIPDSVKIIGDHAFGGCRSLASIDISENNANYKSLDGNLYSKDVKTLIQYAAGNTVTSFIIPSSVTSIGENAFENCGSLIHIEIPNSVTSIDVGMFADCESLTSMTVSFVGFYIPRFIETIKITGGKIGECAFMNCDSLKSVTIGDGVTSIGDFAFDYCKSLTSINFNGTVAEWNGITKGRNWNLFVPATKVVCTDGEVALS